MKNHILILAVIIFLNESLIPFPNYNHAIAQGTKPASEHIIGAYDVLGVYIERVLGNEYELPPVQIPDRESGLTPSTGYPVLVLANGTVALPLVKPIQVKGLTLGIAQSKIRDAYTGILNPRDSPRCMVTLMREPTIEERLLIPKNDYKIGPLDVLGIYLEGITGDPEETKIPVRFASPKEGVIPSAGYPVLVVCHG
ncbi:MAG: polysaccharide biosynthesis/export family protein [Pirellulaceae bacterium]